jgi:Na+-transporting methylmalonyl-CoA/oxaloacetate decarboxylase gamma subunit
MKHPGINRAIPGAILGFVIGELLVLGLRWLQGLPPWDPGVAIVLAPITLMIGWMWGVGAFNPKLSEHGDHHADETTAIVTVDGKGNEIVVHETTEHHEDEEPSEIFFTEVWKAISLPLILLVLVLGFANLPDGFYLAVVDDANASPNAFANSIMLDIPFYGTVETTQMVLFLVFVGILTVSLIAMAGGIGFLIYKGHEQVAIANEIDPGPSQTTPPAPVRALGRATKNTARSLRKNLPKALGNK